MPSPRKHTPRFSALAAAAAAFAALAHTAAAQSTEFRLGADGSWTVAAAPQPGTDEAIIAEARRALAEERPEDARRILDQWIEDHKRTDNPWLPEAYLLRGDARTAAGDEFQALYDYETVIKEFPASSSYVKAIERELDIAVRYVNGLKTKFLGLRLVGAQDAGEELLIRVQERLPGSRLAERAGIELADYYFRTRQMDLATEAYSLFLLNHPRSPYAPKAMQRRVAATIARFKGPRYNGGPLLDATILVRRFAALYPAQAAAAGMDDALLARMDESAGAEMLENAKWYLQVGDPVSARYVLRRLLVSHPRTAAASTGLQIMIERGWIDLDAPAPTTETTQSGAAAQPPAADTDAEPLEPAAAAPAASTPGADRPEGGAA
jgi:tetratricopeptide (TPR) repeat protein